MHVRLVLLLAVAACGTEQEATTWRCPSPLMVGIWQRAEDFQFSISATRVGQNPGPTYSYEGSVRVDGQTGVYVENLRVWTEGGGGFMADVINVPTSTASFTFAIPYTQASTQIYASCDRVGWFQQDLPATQ